jgi:hypothetical protein
VKQLGAGKRNSEIGNAAKKLQMLGLSDEVDHSEKKEKRNPSTAGSLSSASTEQGASLYICIYTYISICMYIHMYTYIYQKQ